MQLHQRMSGLIDRRTANGDYYYFSAARTLWHRGDIGQLSLVMAEGVCRTAREIASEFSTALLRGLIRDESIRNQSPLGI